MSINIRTIHCGEIMENAYMVCREGREDCLLVDPGDDAAKIRRMMGELHLSAILLTHGHFDHILAVGELAQEAGCPVYVGEGDMEMLNDPALNGLKYLMGIDALSTPPIAAQPFGEALQVAGMDLRILPTPGHSKGSVCLYVPEEGVLFSGDTLFRAGFGRMDLYGGSPLQMRASLRTLFALPPETRVYPGHGAATTIGEERGRYGV